MYMILSPPQRLGNAAMLIIKCLLLLGSHSPLFRSIDRRGHSASAHLAVLRDPVPCSDRRCRVLWVLKEFCFPHVWFSDVSVPCHRMNTLPLRFYSRSLCLFWCWCRFHEA